ncbi:MAG TPA: class I SAM-dependent methyltransferase [Rhodanobacteraceae bacterium]
MNGAIPWWGKMAAKIALSRIPVRYAAWERLHLFKHGTMEQPLYALAVFRKHFERSGMQGRHDFSVLEIGPGDTLSTAVIAAASGANRCWLVDAGPFARTDVQPYRDLVASLRAGGLHVGALDRFATRDELLAACNATYLTHGTSSLADIPDAAVDFIFSHAVLEHVRRGEFTRFAGELRRILKPGGVASHQVDLRDHLGGHLNNLRFSERTWESGFMARSGFYTNRIRFHEMLDCFRRAGFDCNVMGTGKFDAIEPVRSAMAAPFRDLPDDELIVSDFDVVLR